MIDINLATLNDFKFYYAIKSDIDNMYWTGYLKKPKYDILFNFFIEQIQNNNQQLSRKVFIIKDNLIKEKYGYIYFDPNNLSTATVSIAVLDKYSGKGIGENCYEKLN